MVLGGGFDLGSAFGKIVIDGSGVDSGVNQAKKSLGDGLKAIGSQISGLGVSLSTVFTPLSIALGKTTSDFINFNEAMTNIQAVTGDSAAETKKLADELLKIGQTSRAGPQAVAEAFYDVAGGVSDASVRMDTLKAALSASEAGSASLGGTVSALIAIMNGYGFSADQASHASDVLTQVVNKGVGTMDEFAAALPNVTGLANAAGISFDDLGSMMAYLTTKGTTASEASTQLTAMIKALLDTTPDMADALKNIGFESGDAALKQLGLVGTFNKLKESGADIPKITGRIEGLRGVIALTGDGFTTFSSQFGMGLDDITARTQKIQDASPAAQMDFLNSALATLSVTIGETLMPILIDLLGQIMPIIQGVIDWVRANPELTAQIGLIIGVLGVLGPILIAVGAAIGAIGAIMSSTLLPIIAIVAAVIWAFQNNFLGLRDTLQPVIDLFSAENGGLAGVLSTAAQAAQDLVNIGLLLLTTTLNNAAIAAQNLINLGLLVITTALNDASTSAQNLVNIGLLLLTTTLNNAATAASQLVAIVQDWITKNSELLGHIVNLAVAFFAAQGLIAAWNFLTTAVTAAKAAIAAAQLGIGGLSGILAGALSPVVVLTAAIWALVEAYKAVQKFQQEAGASMQNASNVLGSQIQSGQITRQQYDTAAFNAVASQFGGGFGGDLLTRLLQAGAIPGVNFNQFMGSVYQANAPHDYFGPYAQDTAYLVGTGAQPEAFIPSTGGGGMAIPNFDQFMQQMGGGKGVTFEAGSVVIHANSAAEGRAAAISFETELRQRLAARGNT